jgi:hypothetical protein
MVRYLNIAKILFSLFMSIKKSVIMTTTKSQQGSQNQNIALYDQYLTIYYLINKKINKNVKLHLT